MNKKANYEKIEMSLSAQEVQELLEAQKKRVEALNQFRSNYKKANKNTKSKREFFEKRLTKLQSWFVDFDHTDKELTQYVDEEQPYVVQQTFELAKAAYMEIRSELQQKNLEFDARDRRNAGEGRSGESQQTTETEATTTVSKMKKIVNLFEDSESEIELDDDDNDDDGYHQKYKWYAIN